MVIALNSAASSLGLRPGRKHCVVFLGDKQEAGQAAQQVMSLLPACLQQVVNPLRHLRKMVTSTLPLQQFGCPESAKFLSCQHGGPDSIIFKY